MTSQGQDRIPAGYVRRAHGIGGDVVVRGMLTDAVERFIAGAILTTNEPEPRDLEIEAVRPHQGDYIITFSGINDRNAADAMRGVQFAIDRSDRRELEPGEWWPEDLVGCSVLNAEGEPVGRVTAVVTGAAQDRIVIETPDGVKGEVPFVAELVPEVDIKWRKVIVDLPDGIFES